ncbi:unnamed protein product [Prunus brigantina]
MICFMERKLVGLLRFLNGLWSSSKFIMLAPRVPHFIRWIKPPSSLLFLNCDGALGKEGCDRGVGGVLMDSEELGMSSFLVASDSQEVAALLKKELGEIWSNLGNIVDEIRKLMVLLPVGDVGFHPRLGIV